jgi:hypothetical protein
MRHRANVIGDKRSGFGRSQENLHGGGAVGGHMVIRAHLVALYHEAILRRHNDTLDRHLVGAPLMLNY